MGFLRDCSGWPPTTSNLPKVTAPEKTGRQSNGENNNVYDFLDSDGYVRLKADMSASSKELYEAYQIYCTENNLPALKPRSFSEALIACRSRYNLEYCNNVTNAAGRRGAWLSGD